MMQFRMKLCWLLIFTFNVSLAKNILVTGATGFIGSYLAEKLLERNDHVVIIKSQKTNKISQYNLEILMNKNGALKIYSLDVNNKEELNNLFLNEKLDVVCHLAAKTNIKESILYPELYLEDIKGTLNLLQLSCQHKIPHFVFASSSTVYGNSSHLPCDEFSLIDSPCNMYAIAKRTSELLTHTFHHLYGISCTCLRLFNVYGPRGIKGAPFIFLNSIHNNSPVYLKNGGDVGRDYIYIDDAVELILQSIDTPENFRIINVGSGNLCTLSDVVTLCEKIVHRAAVINFLPKDDFDVDRIYANTKLAEKLFNFRFKISLENGLQKTYDWLTNEYLKIIEN